MVVRWSSHFLVKMHVSSTKLLSKEVMIQNAYLCVILHVKHM